MKNCRNIYPLKIIRPLNKFPVPFKPQLHSILEDLFRNDSVLDQFIGDNPKRALLKEVLNHASLFGCDYCFGKAIQYAEKNSKVNEETKKNVLLIKKFEKQVSLLKQASGSACLIKSNEEQIKVMQDLVSEIKK